MARCRRRSRPDAGRPRRSQTSTRTRGCAARAAGLQPPPAGGARLRARHAACSAIVAATQLSLNASFEKMIPQSQPVHPELPGATSSDLRGLGNALRIVVENHERRHLRPAVPEALKQINDELFLTPGVDRAWMKSLWTPAVRWTEVTEEGFQRRPGDARHYDGSPRASSSCAPTSRAPGIVGSLVGNDFKSSMIFVPLLDKEPGTGQRSTTAALSHALESRSARSTSRAGSRADGKRRASRSTSSASPSWSAT